MTLGFLGASLIPFYSWSTLLFSIPIAITDAIVGYCFGSGTYGYYIFLGATFGVPPTFLFAIFFEIILIPLALISPITALIGIIFWIIGDVNGY